MSATIDAERFSQYFGGCPIIRVPGFTYPVIFFHRLFVIIWFGSHHNFLNILNSGKSFLFGGCAFYLEICRQQSSYFG